MLTNLKMHRQACCCDLQVLENSSAQLQQQLARKGTELSSAEQSLAFLQQELSQAQHSKHEATKVKLVVCLHHDKTPLHMAIFVSLQLLTLHQDVCCADTCSILILSALREDNSCILLQADSYAGCLMSSAGGSAAVGPAASASGAA